MKRKGRKRKEKKETEEVKKNKQQKIDEDINKSKEEKNSKSRYTVILSVLKLTIQIRESSI